MAEWLKAHDSKSCGQQCLGGSNPLASARIKKTTLVVVFLIFCERTRASEKTTPLLGVAFLFFSTGKSVFLEDVDDLFFTLPDAILAEICDAE